MILSTEAVALLELATTGKPVEASGLSRGKMDASEFKEYIFGALFLKRCSDVFEERHDEIVTAEREKRRTLAEAKKRANHPWNSMIPGRI